MTTRIYLSRFDPGVIREVIRQSLSLTAEAKGESKAARSRGLGSGELTPGEQGMVCTPQSGGEEWRSLADLDADEAQMLLESSAVIIEIRPPGPAVELPASAEEDKAAEREADEMLAEIAASLRRSRKLQTEINALKKKTQAVLDKLK
jgi:hypothetical protein